MCITVVGNKKNIFAKRVIRIGKPLSYEELGFSNDEEPFHQENIERLQELLWSKSQNLEKWIEKISNE